AGFVNWRANLSGGGDPERVEVGLVTGNLFRVLGTSALLGRTLEEGDSSPGAAAVTVLSEASWRRRFDADPGIVGRSVTVNGRPTTVVGVMRASFQLPPGVALWRPIVVDNDLRQARGRWMRVVARLRPEATLAQARE